MTCCMISSDDYPLSFIFTAYRDLLQESNGFGAVIVDEMYGTLRNLSTSDDTAANCLNKIWCGAKIRLRYKSATSLKLDRVCSSFYGSIHPHDFCNLLKGWVSGNGFEDRWLITVVDDLVADIVESDEASRNMPKPNFSFNSMFKALFEYFNTLEEIEIFSFSLEAYHLLGSMSKDLKELKRKRNEKIHNHGMSNTVPEEFLSKLEDNVQKIALAFHILSSSVKSYFEQHYIAISNTIPLCTVEKAMKFVKTSADAIKHMDNAGSSNASTSQYFSIQMSPGPFVTSRILNDTFGDHKQFTRVTEEDFISKCELLETQGYGQLLHPFFPDYHKSVPTFYKSPLTPALNNLLLDHNFIPTEYAAKMSLPFKKRKTKIAALQHVIDFLKQKNPYDKEQEAEEERTAHPNRKKKKVQLEELVEESDSSDSESAFDGVDIY